MIFVKFDNKILMDKLQKTKQRRRTTISVASAKNPKDDSASKLYRKINNVKDIYALMEPLSCKKNQERRYFSNKGNT